MSQAIFAANTARAFQTLQPHYQARNAELIHAAAQAAYNSRHITPGIAGVVFDTDYQAGRRGENEADPSSWPGHQAITRAKAAAMGSAGASIVANAIRNHAPTRAEFERRYPGRAGAELERRHLRSLERSAPQAAASRFQALYAGRTPAQVLARQAERQAQEGEQRVGMREAYAGEFDELLPPYTLSARAEGNLPRSGCRSGRTGRQGL